MCDVVWPKWQIPEMLSAFGDVSKFGGEGGGGMNDWPVAAPSTSSNLYYGPGLVGWTLTLLANRSLLLCHFPLPYSACEKVGLGSVFCRVLGSFPPLGATSQSQISRNMEEKVRKNSNSKFL